MKALAVGQASRKPFGSVLRLFTTLLTTTGAFYRPVRGSASRHTHRGRTMAAAGPLNYPAPVVVKASKTPTAAIFMMHGLGDSAHGWAGISDELQPELPYANLIFPNAPTRPITLNYGMSMPGWYDITSLDGINANEDKEGLEESKRYIESLVQQQIDSGIPSNRIVIAGFSQGGAVALMMLRSNITFGGIAALSGYLPLTRVEPVVSEANKNTPVAMFHGDADQVVRSHSFVQLKS
eukprot:jgi/Botrbrau1/3994/Bobra.0016s0007.2